MHSKYYLRDSVYVMYELNDGQRTWVPMRLSRVPVRGELVVLWDESTWRVRQVAHRDMMAAVVYLEPVVDAP